MSAPRVIDYDEARRLRAEGVRVVEIAAMFGVTCRAVWRATNDEILAREREYARAWQNRGVCADCGGPCTYEGHPSQCNLASVPLCITCVGRRRRKPLVVNGNGEVAVKCGRCKQTKPLSEFSARLARLVAADRALGKSRCRACDTATRRDYRERHKVPCERCGEPCLPPSEKGSHGADRALCLACYRTPEPVRSEAVQPTKGTESSVG